MKEQYLQDSQCLFHRDTVTKIRKRKHGNGWPHWGPSIQAGKPPMLLGAAALVLELFTDREHCIRLDADTKVGLVV